MLVLLAFAVKACICLLSNSVSTGGAKILILGDLNLVEGFFFIVKFNLSLVSCASMRSALGLIPQPYSIDECLFYIICAVAR